jgi:hypothetical protein
MRSDYIFRRIMGRAAGKALKFDLRRYSYKTNSQDMTVAAMWIVEGT